ncbi:MAG: rimM [Bacteroidota bacterium]|jgi:16S rRNA processing protein RimM|nr:rimM [Bacteroidota bacterium]
MMNKSECFSLGYIAKTVGNKGELILILDVDDPFKYKKLESVFVEINKELVPFFITRMEVRSNGAKVNFDGIDTTERAEHLKGHSLYLPLSFLPPLKGKKFYYHEVVGFNVVDKIHGDIGNVLSILDYPTQALFQIKKGETEILIPVKDEFIISIDRPSKTIHVSPPEGLIDIYLDPTHEEPDTDDFENDSDTKE